MCTSVSLAAAVNNDSVLQSNLLRSPDLSCFQSTHYQRGFASAAMAYNPILDAAISPVVVFLHQDVFLPRGCFNQLISSLCWLETHAPNWGVLGLYGCTHSNERHGFLYSTGLQRFVGAPIKHPQRVRTLDEVMLVVNTRHNLRFDESLPGFHLYGTDICLQAERQGLENYVIPAFAIHNSNGYTRLPWDYWRTYLDLRRKWKPFLPVHTPCAEITKHALPLLNKILRDHINVVLNRTKPAGRRATDPVALYHSLSLSSCLKSL